MEPYRKQKPWRLVTKPVGPTPDEPNTEVRSSGEFRPSLHHYPQIWLLVISLIFFGLYVAWDLRVLTTVVALDRSYITSVIAALVMLASAHIAWHLFRYSRRIEVAHNYLSGQFESGAPRQYRPRDDGFMQSYLLDLEPIVNTQSAELIALASDSVIEIRADQLRSPVELGWFLVDLAVRLGLVGTIIGFILIFTSLSDSTISGAEGLKELLIAMSGGMGTALLTTLCGLAGATILSVQYLILGRAGEYLIALLLRIRNHRMESAGTNMENAGTNR